MTLFKYSSSESDPATTYFAPWFIRDVEGPILAGWEFDLTRARCPFVNNYMRNHWHGCFSGVLVKSTLTQEVWRLTGNIDSQGYFEGRWPD